MNPQSHRLVFNPSRGCLMAVAETSRSSGKSSASGTTRSTRSQRTLCPRRTELQASNWPLATVPIAQAAINSIAIATVKASNLLAAANTQNSRLKDAAALKAGYDAYKMASPTDAGATGGTAEVGSVSQGIGVSIHLDSSSSSTDSAANKSMSRGTNVQAKDIVIQATQGDITATAAKLQADNITLNAAKNVNLIAAANLETNTSSNHSDSAGVGVTVGLGQNSGISFQLRAAQAQGRSNGTETTFDNTQVTATKNLTVKSGSDTNLIGAQLAAETVKMEVGTSGKGALNIETLQNTSTFKSEQSSSGFDVSLCIPPICYGVPVTVSVSVSQQAIDHNYISAVGQSGVAAGSGGFDINVAGNTDLKGAAITSTASANKNTLETQSLTSSDLANAQSTSSSSSSITVGNNLTAMVVGNVLANLAGKDGLPENGSQSGKTLSVISPGAVTITGSGNASTDATSGQQVALLTSRDASTANGALTNTLTLQQAQGLQAKQKEIQENMQAGQLVGSVAYNMAGDIAAKNQWGESSPQKIALHAIAGFIQASAAGRNGAAGALAGAANEALTKTVNDAIDKAMQLPANATPEQVRENAQSHKALAEGAAQLIGMAAVALGGGSAQDVRLGGAVALNADRFNRQLHETEIDLIKRRARDFARAVNGGKEPTPEQITAAQDRLMAQGQRLVDATLNDYKVDQPAIDFLRNVVARDATVANSGKDPLFNAKDGGWNTLFTASPNDFFNPNINATQGDLVKRSQAMQEIAKVFSNPNSVGNTNPQAYLGQYLDYAKMSEAANQVGKDGALCLTGAGCMYVNARNFIDGVEAIKRGDTKAGWTMIGLSLVGGGVSAAALKQEVGMVQNAAAKTLMTNKLKAQGVKFTVDDILAMKRLPDGRIVFLERGQVGVPGTKDAGMAHIIQEHGAEFANAGINAADLPKVLMDAVNSGKFIGYQGKGTARAIYVAEVNGQPVKIAVQVANNGYIVGANYLGRVK